MKLLILLPIFLVLAPAARPEGPAGVVIIPVAPGAYSVASVPFDPLPLDGASTVAVAADHAHWGVYKWDAERQVYEAERMDAVAGQATWRARSQWAAGQAVTLRNEGGKTVWLHLSGAVVADAERRQIITPGLNLLGAPFSSAVRSGESEQDAPLRTDLTPVTSGELIHLAEAVWRVNEKGFPFPSATRRPYPPPHGQSARVTGIRLNMAGMLEISADLGTPGLTYAVHAHQANFSDPEQPTLSGSPAALVQADQQGGFVAMVPAPAPVDQPVGIFFSIHALDLGEPQNPGDSSGQRADNPDVAKPVDSAWLSAEARDQLEKQWFQDAANQLPGTDLSRRPASGEAALELVSQLDRRIVPAIWTVRAQVESLDR